VRIAEVDRDAGGDGELFVARHLCSLVPGDGADEFGWQLLDGPAHRRLHLVSLSAIWQVEQ
jgi:hypothetical protein